MAILLGYDFVNAGSATPWQSFSPSTGSDSVTKIFGGDTVVGSGTGYANTTADFVFSNYETTTLTIQDGGVTCSHSMSNSADMLELYVRVQGSGACYLCRVEAGASAIKYYDGSTETQLGASGGGYTYTAGPDFFTTEFKMVGDTLTVTMNGSVLLTRTSTAITAAGKLRCATRSNGSYNIDYVEFADTSSVTPVLSSPATPTVTGSQTATVGATTDTGSGTLYTQILPAADAAPDAATIIGAATASVAVASTGAKTIDITGLTASTAYKAHFAQTGPSNVVSSASFTTEAAPTLTSPTAGATGTSTASGSVTTNVTGTLYRYASTNSTELAATVKASGSTFTVTTAGAQTGLTFTGLTPGSTYYAHYVLTKGGVDSSRVSSSSFVQSSAVAFSGTVPSQSGTVGSAFSLALSSYFSGSLTPFVYSVLSGSLPAGLSLNTSTGAISGVPTTAANYSAVVRATDTAANTANTGTISFSIGASGSSIAFSGTVPAKAVTVDTAFSWGTPALSSYFSGGTSPYTYAVTTGTLPTGLSLNTGTGVISGTPTATGTSALVITATDAAAGTAASNSFNIVVSAAGAATLTLQDFKFWTGTSRASETVGFVKVIRASSGVVVLELTDQAITAGGAMVIASASLLAGNDYLVIGFPSGAAESFRKLVTAI